MWTWCDEYEAKEENSKKCTLEVEAKVNDGTEPIYIDDDDDNNDDEHVIKRIRCVYWVNGNAMINKIYHSSLIYGPLSFILLYNSMLFHASMSNIMFVNIVVYGDFEKIQWKQTQSQCVFLILSNSLSLSLSLIRKTSSPFWRSGSNRTRGKIHMKLIEQFLSGHPENRRKKCRPHPDNSIGVRCYFWFHCHSFNHSGTFSHCNQRASVPFREQLIVYLVFNCSWESATMLLVCE